MALRRDCAKEVSHQARDKRFSERTMSLFALDFQMEMPHAPAPPQGWEAVWIFANPAARKQQLANS